MGLAQPFSRTRPCFCSKGLTCGIASNEVWLSRGGVLGTAALAAHAIHKGVSLHHDLNDRRGWEPVDIQHHGIGTTVRF